MNATRNELLELEAHAVFEVARRIDEDEIGYYVVMAPYNALTEGQRIAAIRYKDGGPVLLPSNWQAKQPDMLDDWEIATTPW